MISCLTCPIDAIDMHRLRRFFLFARLEGEDRASSAAPMGVVLAQAAPPIQLKSLMLYP